MTAAPTSPESRDPASHGELLAVPGDLIRAARGWFPAASAILLVGALDATGVEILASESTVALPERLELPLDHPLRTLAQFGGDLHLDRETGPTPLLAVPGMSLNELCACALPGGQMLLRLATDPQHRAALSERLLLQLLGVGSLATLRGPEPDWRGQLAGSLLGENEETQLTTQALAILAGLLPDSSLALWEINPRTGEARVIGVGGGLSPEPRELQQWHQLDGRLRDAVLLDRPLLGLDPGHDLWLHAAAPQLPMPAAPMLSLWPCGSLGAHQLVLFLGLSRAAMSPGLGAMVSQWSTILRRALDQSRLVVGLRFEAHKRETELNIAASIQRSLLPAESEIDGWDLAIYHATDSELAGDFVLVDRSDSLLHIAIGDVAGRGIPASLTMMAAYSLLLARLGRGTALAEVLAHWSSELNRLSERNQERGGDLSYTTLVLVRLDPATGALEFGKAGHPYPLHYRASTHTIEKWDAMGYPAGLFSDQEFEVLHHRLEPGDALVLYTDGLSEAGIGEGHLGTDRLIEVLTRFGDCPAPIIKERLLRALELHLKGQAVGDDTTFVVLTHARGLWHQRDRVARESLAAALLPPESFATDQPDVRGDVLDAIHALGAALQLWLGSAQPAEGYQLRWCVDATHWHAAIVIPDLLERLPGSERPDACLHQLMAPEHPLRLVAQAMDFAWVRPERSELHLIRRVPPQRSAPHTTDPTLIPA